MPIGALIGAGAGLLGGVMQADATKDAARTAAKASEFKPYNITSGLGDVKFDRKGNTVDYTLDPNLRAYQNSMFNLANQAIPTTSDPTEAANALYNQYNAMTAPERERSFGMLQNSQFNNGTLGLGIGGTAAGGYGQRNPALASWLEAQNQAQQKMFLQAQDSARNYLDSDIKRSTGLLGQGIGVEQVGYDMINLGSTLGGRQSQANGQAAQILGAGYANAAKQQNNVIDGIMDMVNQGVSKIFPTGGGGGAVSNPFAAVGGGGFNTTNGGGYGSVGTSGYTASPY